MTANNKVSYSLARVAEVTATVTNASNPQETEIMPGDKVSLSPSRAATVASTSTVVSSTPLPTTCSTPAAIRPIRPMSPSISRWIRPSWS